MKHERKTQSIPTLLSLLVLAVFAVGILGVLLSGARAYQRLTAGSSRAYDSRTCCAYLAAKVRQAPGKVEVASFGDGDALVFHEEISGGDYLTRVYCHDGWLMELFTAAGGGFAPEDGEKILPIDTMELEQVDGLLTVRILGTNGQTSQLMLQNSGHEEVAP